MTMKERAKYVLLGFVAGLCVFSLLFVLAHTLSLILFPL